MKLPLITRLKFDGSPIIHVLDFVRNAGLIWAIGVNEKDNSIKPYQLSDLEVMPEDEYQAWKAERKNPNASASVSLLEFQILKKECAMLGVELMRTQVHLGEERETTSKLNQQIEELTKEWDVLSQKLKMTERAIAEKVKEKSPYPPVGYSKEELDDASGK